MKTSTHYISGIKLCNQKKVHFNMLIIRIWPNYKLLISFLFFLIVFTTTMALPNKIIHTIVHDAHEMEYAERMPETIVVIQSLVFEYLSFHHWIFDSVINDALNFIQTPALDVDAAHDFFEA